MKLVESEKVYPAHYRITDDTVQSVEEHLHAVQLKCEKYAGELQLGCSGKLLGLLHDVGKFTDEFYEYITEAIQREKEGEQKQATSVDHGRHGALLMLERYHNGSALRRTMSEILAMIICYHHGGMEDYITDELEIKLLDRCGDPDIIAKTDKKYIQARERFLQRVINAEQLDELFNAAVIELQLYIDNLKQNGFNILFNLHLLIKFLYSCLIDADRYDTYLFMQSKHEKDDLDIRFIWDTFSKNLSAKEDSFEKLPMRSGLEGKIRGLRNDIWKQCRSFAEMPSGIYTLTVPTGGGKTLSSLRYAINHAILKGKKRIIYILPFTSIIEQNAGVVRNVLEADDYLLEHHSNVVMESSDNDSECNEYRRLLTEQWTSPIIFTTMVQFLNTLFAGGTQSIRRLHNLTDAILIFDEIQALPVKCISLFNETINFLSTQCRDTVLLCSATQPNLDNVKHRINVKQEIIKDMQIKFNDFKRMEIIDARYKRKMSMSEIGEFIFDLKKENDSILIILNTKKAAEAVYTEVKQKSDDQEIIFYFLSTNLCPAHRKKIIKEMKEDLNKHKQVICVSTQLIEAGVDISFSCVVRHIAGLDSIAQASGRGNRNGEGTIKETYIIQLEDERLGSLKEIEIGEKCAVSVLDEYNKNKENFDNSLLSPKAIQRYYQYFFNEKDIEKKLDYSVPEKANSIFDMLSNPKKKLAYKNTYNKEYPLTLEFQFKTASRFFEVIDEVQTGILVPFDKGKDIINVLLSRETPFPDIKLLREAQLYMVNVSKNTYQVLKTNQAVFMEDRSGVLILKDNFYDMELGVIPEGRTMDILLM